MEDEHFDSCKLFEYIWLLGAPPQTPPGFRPWTPLEDLCSDVFTGARYDTHFGETKQISVVVCVSKL